MNQLCDKKLIEESKILLELKKNNSLFKKKLEKIQSEKNENVN